MISIYYMSFYFLYIITSILSNNYFSLDGFYRRIIIYYATYLKYIGVLIPQMKGKPNKQTIEIYNKAMNFVNVINMNSLCVDFGIKALLNGTYYGVVHPIFYFGTRNDCSVLQKMLLLQEGGSQS